MKLAGKLRPAYFLYKTFWSAVDWVFPPTCGGCGQMGFRWCDSCQQQVERISNGYCFICGEPLDLRTGVSVCSKCLTHPPHYQKLRSYAIFKGTLRNALHRLKYQRDIGIGEALSKHLIELYNQLKWDVDLIAPVPLNTKRIQERGYNQSDMLGRPLAYAVMKPYRPDILWRNRETRSQVGLSAQERQQNVAGAFTAQAERVRGKVILLVDDVTTTGSTIDACARALRDAGASAVYGLTLTRAAPQADADDPLIPSQINGGIYGSRGRDLS